MRHQQFMARTITEAVSHSGARSGNGARSQLRVHTHTHTETTTAGSSSHAAAQHWSLKTKLPSPHHGTYHLLWQLAFCFSIIQLLKEAKLCILEDRCWLQRAESFSFSTRQISTFDQGPRHRIQTRKIPFGIRESKGGSNLPFQGEKVLRGWAGWRVSHTRPSPNKASRAISWC